MADVELPRCGPECVPGGGVRWTVWAPLCRSVELVLLDGDQRRNIAMEPRPRGFFTHTDPAAGHGQRYHFRLDGERERADPCSRWQPNGLRGPSVVVDPTRFQWTDGGWKGVAREDLVVYELHVGTFTPEGTFDAIIPRLRALKELGVTAVELMPLAQFPGGRGWGYDGAIPYAVQNTYGGPDGLRRLVDAAHAAGLAVIVDAVYNHLGPEDAYLHEFGHYFTDHYRTPWGRAINYDGPGSDPVRAYVVANARMWVEEYHADGLRLDAVHAIYDFSASHILREVGEAVRAAGERAGRRVHVIAESDLNDVRLLLPPERGGYGLDAQWSDDFHHAVHARLTGERHGYYSDFGTGDELAKVLVDPFLYAGTFSAHRDRRHGGPSGGLPGDQFVVSVQNHDQVGNRASGDRFGTLLTPPRQRLAACLLLLSPHVPMMFMGEEYGEERPFPYFCSFDNPELVEAVRKGRRSEFAAFNWQGEVPDPQAEETFRSAVLSWAWPEGTRYAGQRHLYADLLAVRREWPALRDFANRSARMRPDADGVLELTRGAGGELAAVFNLTDRPQRMPEPRGGVLFRSESARYGGGRRETDPADTLLPFECVVSGPARWRKVS